MDQMCQIPQSKDDLRTACDFLDDYDDESTKAARQANSDEQDAYRSLCDAVKEEYNLWLRLHEIRAVDSIQPI